MPEISNDLLTTLAALLLEIVMIVLCRRKLMQPVDLARPRLMPYSAIILVLTVAVVVTSAHAVSLLTGHSVVPNQPTF